MKNNIEYRNDQVSGKISWALDTLQSVEISISNECNRNCDLCPNKLDNKQHMTLDTVDYITKRLKEINYTGRLGLSGFGEPMTHSEIWSVILLLSASDAQIELITNGDYLNVEVVRILHHTGVSKFLVSLYDGPQQIQKFEKMFDKAGVPDALILRHRYNTNENFNNRGGLLWKAKVEGPCYLPFYKLMINWNGDYHVCSNDWVGLTAELNVQKTSIEDFWFSKQMTKYRLDLLKGKRSLVPCKNCDCQGTLVGEKQFEYFEKYYGYKKNTLDSV